MEVRTNVRVVTTDVANLTVQRESQKIAPPGGQTAIAGERYKREGQNDRIRSQS
jgi:hypothetical protein